MSKLQQSQELQQKLSPQQILQAKILQLNAMNLEQRILSEIEMNPALELDILKNDDEVEEIETLEDDNEETDEINELDEKNEETEFEWEEILADPDEYEYSKSGTKSAYEIPLHVIKTMTDIFMEQLRDINTSDSDMEIAEQILGNLDEHGYLTIEPVLISDKMGVEEKNVLDIMEKIRHLSPPGFASQTIRECLLAQLEVFGDNAISLLILKDYFEDFTQHRYEKIIDAMKCSKEEFNDAIEVISQMNPHPGDGIEYNDKDFVIPDVYIEERNGEWVINLNDSLPEIKINKNYRNMLKKYNDKKDVKKFIHQKIESAEWFINALNERKKTIVGVVESIIYLQDTYFNSDKRQLKPMVLKDIANRIGVDVSTVSRATNGRYIQLPWEIKELKSFFSESISTKKGKDVSNTVVKKRLKDIIDNEDKKNPLGDEQLMGIMQKEGYQIARRTISKYREGLKYPAARLRREL